MLSLRREASLPLFGRIPHVGIADRNRRGLHAVMLFRNHESCFRYLSRCAYARSQYHAFVPEARLMFLSRSIHRFTWPSFSPTTPLSSVRVRTYVHTYIYITYSLCPYHPTEKCRRVDRSLAMRDPVNDTPSLFPFSTWFSHEICEHLLGCEPF